MSKPSLAGLLGGSKGEEPEEVTVEEGDDEGDMEGAKMDAAQALLDAVKANDAKGVSEALSAHADLCTHHGDE